MLHSDNIFYYHKISVEEDKKNIYQGANSQKCRRGARIFFPFLIKKITEHDRAKIPKTGSFAGWKTCRLSYRNPVSPLFQRP